MSGRSTVTVTRGISTLPHYIIIIILYIYIIYIYIFIYILFYICIYLYIFLFFKNISFMFSRFPLRVGSIIPFQREAESHIAT